MDNPVKSIAQLYMSMQEKVEYPHMMYDPKTGKEVEAKTPADHAKYAKMGYTHDKPKMEKKMDPVGKADKDIDNDGDVDSSDEYLHNRRKAIKKAMKKEETVLEASQHPDHSKNMKAAAEYHGHMAAHHKQSQEHHDDKVMHHDTQYMSHSDKGNDVGADHHADMTDRHSDKHDDHEAAHKAHDLAHKAAKKGDMAAYKKHMNAARKASDAAHKPRGSDMHKVSTKPTSHLAKAGHNAITSDGHMKLKSMKKPSGPAGPADRRNPTGAMVGVRENSVLKSYVEIMNEKKNSKATGVHDNSTAPKAAEVEPEENPNLPVQKDMAPNTKKALDMHRNNTIKTDPPAEKNKYGGEKMKQAAKPKVLKDIRRK